MSYQVLRLQRVILSVFRMFNHHGRIAIQKQQPVLLDGIQTWTEFYNKDKIELINCLLSKGESSKQEIEGQFDIDPEINSKISLYEGDITCLQVDGIVSPNNTNLKATGGASRRIQTVAGPEFEKETRKLNGCHTAEAKTTLGFNLPAKYVVHTVGPQKVEPNLLEKCYKSCLEEMNKYSMKSLAIPCIATGAYGYPNDKAVLVALKTVRLWLEELKRKQQLDTIERIVFCLFTPEDVALYRKWMQVFYPVFRVLLPLNGYIETTTTEPDMLGLDDESPVRAKMPCGHVIGPVSMTDYCRDLLEKGGYRFYCPSNGPPPCNREWEYFLVRHVAHLTAQEMHEFERKLAENYLKKAAGMQRCPGCHTWCFRAQGTGSCVRCSICTKSSGRRFDFCWWCLNTWNAATGKQPCGNAGCDGRDGRLKILETCPTKKINTCSDCPSIRGCPKCGILVEHKDKCGHVVCTNCGDYGFCFICLTEKQNQKWQCSPWTGTCELAPRQSALPGTQ